VVEERVAPPSWGTKPPPLRDALSGGPALVAQTGDPEWPLGRRCVSLVGAIVVISTMEF
jgi:hypothetical protein